MSLPPHIDSQPSSSPSKSSLRRISGAESSKNNPSPGPTTHFASVATQHHYLPHSPPNQNLDYEEEDDDDGGGRSGEEAVYAGDSSYQTAPQPQVPFQPFFALIEDIVTSEHYHPTVHYIFAEDEPDIITEAACRSLGDGIDDPRPTDTAAQEQERDEEDVASRLPPPRPGVKEHYLLLDVQPSPNTGPASQQQLSDRLPSPSPSSVETAQALLRSYPYVVTSAQSLSPDWQVFRTSITDAPTMNAEQQNPDEQHLMLRIEGRGTSPDKPLQRREGETVEDLIERYQTRLAEIRHLLADVDDEATKQALDAEAEGDMFTQGGLVGMGFQPSGFGNAVLDEQD